MPGLTQLSSFPGCACQCLSRQTLFSTLLSWVKCDLVFYLMSFFGRCCLFHPLTRALRLVFGNMTQFKTPILIIMRVHSTCGMWGETCIKRTKAVRFSAKIFSRHCNLTFNNVTSKLITLWKILKRLIMPVFHCLGCCLYRQQVHQHSTPLAVDTVIAHSERIEGRSIYSECADSEQNWVFIWVFLSNDISSYLYFLKYHLSAGLNLQPFRIWGFSHL